VAPPSTPGADPAKLAAQRAFFQAALGKTSAPQAPATPVAAAAPQPPQRTAAVAAADAPQRILRPGSLIDIRV
jgi:hypothetical protein